jgi:RNA polymerase sporulation-specific sigma factor
MGDQKAREELIVKHRRLVFSIAKKYKNNQNKEDIISSGMIGLIKAVDNFDEKFKVKFITYAYFKINGNIKDYLRTIKTTNRSNLKIKFEEFVEKKFTTPSTTIVELINKEQIRKSNLAFSKLPTREQSILEMTLKEINIREIAKQINIEKSWAYRLRERAIASMRETINNMDK